MFCLINSDKSYCSFVLPSYFRAFIDVVIQVNEFLFVIAAFSEYETNVKLCGIEGTLSRSFREEGRGHWTVIVTGIQSFINRFPHWLT